MQNHQPTILDARPLLAAGIHPLNQVIEATAGLVSGESYGIITPFPPQPMIQKLSDLGFDVQFSETEPGVFLTFFKKP